MSKEITVSIAHPVQALENALDKMRLLEMSLQGIRLNKDGHPSEDELLTLQLTALEVILRISFVMEKLGEEKILKAA
jgi:hypothetical protein